MALKTQYDNESDIPEAHKELFTEKDDKWYMTEVEGLKTSADTDRLQASLVKERDAHKETKTKLGKFGTAEPEKVAELQTELNETKALLVTAEAAAGEGKVDQDAINKLVDAKVATVARPLERKIEELTAKTVEQGDTIIGHERKDTTRTITDAVRKAATESKVIASAMDDAIMLAERQFEVVDGVVLTRDEVGATPGIDPTVWLSEMQDKRPHWWERAQGGGAGGGGGGGGAGGTDNPFSFKGWNMTEQGTAVRLDPERAARLATSAGTTVGGPKPADPAAAKAA